MNSKAAGVGVVLGLCFGTALGAAFHSVGAGVAIGVSMGVSFALALGASDAAARTKVVIDKPLPHPLGLFERDEPK